MEGRDRNGLHGRSLGASRAANYHDLVDMPFFVGAFDVDSQLVADKWVRLASYPSGQLSGAGAGGRCGSSCKRMFPPLIAVSARCRGIPTRSLTLFDSTSQGGSALEHSNSHFGIYSPFIIGNIALPSIIAHEIFHVWNVKRLRPAEMVPYRYDRAQPTPWLWVSEGITDYYADLALVRGGIVDSAGFRRPDATTRSTRSRPRRRSRSKMRRFRRGFIRSTGPATSTIPRARSPASCWT